MPGPQTDSKDAQPQKLSSFEIGAQQQNDFAVISEGGFGAPSPIWAILQQLQSKGFANASVGPVACESVAQAQEVLARLQTMLGQLKAVEPAFAKAVAAEIQSANAKPSETPKDQFTLYFERQQRNNAIGQVQDGLSIMLGCVRAHSLALKRFAERSFDPKDVLAVDPKTGEPAAPPEGWTSATAEDFARGLGTKSARLDGLLRGAADTVASLKAPEVNADPVGSFKTLYLNQQGQQITRGDFGTPWNMEGYGSLQGGGQQGFNNASRMLMDQKLEGILGSKTQGMPPIVIMSDHVPDFEPLQNVLKFATVGSHTSATLTELLADGDRVGRLQTWLITQRKEREEAEKAQQNVQAMAIKPGGAGLTSGMIEGALLALANEPGEAGSLSISFELGHETFFTELGASLDLTFSFVQLDTGECQLGLARTVELAGGLRLGDYAGVKGSIAAGAESAVRTQTHKAMADFLLHAIHGYRDKIIQLAGEERADMVRSVIPLGDAPKEVEYEALIEDSSTSVGVEAHVGSELAKDKLGWSGDAGVNSTPGFSGKSANKRSRGGGGGNKALSGSYDHTTTKRTFTDQEGNVSVGKIEAVTYGVGFALPLFGLGDLSVSGSVSSERVEDDINADNNGSYWSASVAIVYEPGGGSKPEVPTTKVQDTLSSGVIEGTVDKIATYLAKKSLECNRTMGRNLVVKVGNMLKTTKSPAERKALYALFDRGTAMMAEADSPKALAKAKAGFMGKAKNNKLVQWLRSKVLKGQLDQSRKEASKSGQMGASFEWMFVYEPSAQGGDELCLQYFRIKGGMGFQAGFEAEVPTSWGTFTAGASVSGGKSEVYMESIGEHTLSYIKAMYNADPDKDQDKGRWAEFKTSNRDAIHNAMVHLIWNQGKGPRDGKVSKAHYAPIFERMEGDLRGAGEPVDGDRSAIEDASVLKMIESQGEVYMDALEDAIASESSKE